VITRQPHYSADGAVVVADIESALRAAGDVEEIAVIGGGEIYAMVFPKADRIYLTEVALDVAGDTSFPAVNPTEWQEVAHEVHDAGPKDSAGFTLRTLDRLK
jgi:dihydrofolate reductase